MSKCLRTPFSSSSSNKFSSPREKKKEVLRALGNNPGFGRVAKVCRSSFCGISGLSLTFLMFTFTDCLLPLESSPVKFAVIRLSFY